METIVWTTDLEIGHPEIDTDHRSVVRLLHQLQEASSRADPAEVRTLLKALAALLREHFIREEQLMLDIHYEHAARHQKEHLHLFEEVRAQIEDFNDGTVSAGVIVDFLGRWLMDHIAYSDRQLAAALLQRNPRPTGQRHRV